jgi:hypothetical protein
MWSHTRTGSLRVGGGTGMPVCSCRHPASHAPGSRFPSHIRGFPCIASSATITTAFSTSKYDTLTTSYSSNPVSVESARLAHTSYKPEILTPLHDQTTCTAIPTESPLPSLCLQSPFKRAISTTKMLRYTSRLPTRYFMLVSTIWRFWISMLVWLRRLCYVQ